MKRLLGKSKMARLATALFLLCLSGPGLLGCKGPDESSALAIVGGHVITLGEYRNALKRLVPPGQPKEQAGSGDPGETMDLKKELLNQLIEEELILKEAARQNITVTAQELLSEMEGLKKEYGDEAFKNAIAERYGSLENWKEEIRRKLIVRKVIDRVVNSRPQPTDEEAKRYYVEHVTDYDAPEQVRARMIVAASEEEARKIRTKLRPSNFAETARARSLSPEAKDGGDLGFFARGEMPLEFEEVVFKLRPGEISPVVKTEYGYHIFMVQEKKPGGRLRFDEVKDRIKERLKLDGADSEVSNWLSNLKKNEKIEVNERLL